MRTPTRTLVLGAGATGGYFGGRLLEAGHEVSFLVRPQRASVLRKTGLVIHSPEGIARLEPELVLAERLKGTYDLIILSCKAYDLDSAMEAVAPAVGKETAILPLLNGLKHYETLDARFGAERVLGGLCSIAVTVGEDGSILHLMPMHVLRFGERDGSRSPRIEALEEMTAIAKMDAKASKNIVLALWEKWVMLASLAGMTCLMRASVGDIMAVGCGRALTLQMLDECVTVATACGHAPRPAILEATRDLLTKPGSPATASMLRDVENGNPVEADHVLGDLVARGAEAGVQTPLLRTAYCHLKAYEERCTREN
jgi:2-dehydropantoate 2-reductase